MLLELVIAISIILLVTKEVNRKAVQIHIAIKFTNVATLDSTLNRINSQAAGCLSIQLLILLFPDFILSSPYLPTVFHIFCSLYYYGNIL